MPQMDIEIIYEQIFAFYFAFIFIMGQQISLNIKKNGLYLKLRRFYIEFYAKKTLNLRSEKQKVIKWHEEFML